MIRLRKKIIFSALTLVILAGAFWFLFGSSPVRALDTGLNFVNETGLSAQDPRATVAKIIRIILGFLGILGVGILIYAGFIWMTAKGEEEKINQAKKIMISASIGLVIVLASFGIASFVINRLSDATSGGSSSGVCDPACLSGQYCCSGVCQNSPCGGGIGSDNFVVTGATPAHQATNVIRNAVIRFRFNDGIKSSSLSTTSFTVKAAGSSIKGVRSINGNYIEFVPEDFCPAPNETLKCFPKDTLISVEAKNGASGIISVNNKELSCGGASRCLVDFTTGSIVDIGPPTVSITSQQICAATNNTIKASSVDDYGVSKTDFFVANNLIGSSINPLPLPNVTFNAETLWNATGNPGDEVLIKATAYDLDSNYASATKTIRLSAAHCCNGVKDADETGIDCGGSCLSCTGQACSTDENLPNQCSDDLCSSGFCNTTGSSIEVCKNAGYPSGTNTCCLCQARPVINWVSPVGGFCSNNPDKFCRKTTEVADCGAGASCDLGAPNGDTGNFVTISGSGFGTTRGKVFFSGSSTAAPLADDPTYGNTDCTKDVWTDNQIIAVVPAGATDGKIYIETSSGAKDETSDAYGPLIANFKKNAIDRPGICALSPGVGKMNDSLVYKGVKLNSLEAYYGNLSSNIKALVSIFSNPKQGTATVPNLASGATTTFVSGPLDGSNPESNFLNFTKENEPYDGPLITSIEPLSGPIGQYLTIRGSGFGASRSTSKIFFNSSSSNKEADYAFPDVCAQSIWSDNQIVVKVPNGLAVSPGYKITLQRVGFQVVDSGDQLFEVTAGSPDPGVCRLQPSVGKPKTTVLLWGEYFGNKDNNSIVRFYNNKDQKNEAIISWAIDNSASGIKPWKVETTVPQAAVSGPVRLLAGSPSKQSNSINFIVGQCTKDADCGGAGATCCAAGLPEAGKCVASASECYGSVATSVYQWRFSTGASLTQCAPDQEQCGTVCCAAGNCENASESKCKHCRPLQNECGDGSCCNQACTPGIGGGPSTCPDPNSCSGYSYNQCVENYYCPNSGGVCSPYKALGGIIQTGDCTDDACNLNKECEGGLCNYDLGRNRCVKTSTELCQQNGLRDEENNVIPGVIGECKKYNNNLRWHISWSQSCPAGWIKLANNFCVDASSINGSCTVCENPFVCEGLTVSGVTTGKCALPDPVCTAGAVCNPENGKCEKQDSGDCACCCRKSNPAQDCCNGLACEGSCGADPATFGLCTGCVVAGVPDDSLCNCLNASGKYCDDSTNPRGVCNDCSSITDPTECSKHEQCCVDGKNNNRCTGIAEPGGRFEKEGLQYCSYYNCNTPPPYPNTCNITPLISGVYKKLNTCQTSCPTAPVLCGAGINTTQCTDTSCPPGMSCDRSTCECKSSDPPAGAPCKDPSGNCTGSCAGYNCLLPAAYSGPGPGTNDCRCCCKPPVNPGDIDSCKAINSNLSCLADKEPCTSATRGLCCGCSRDSQCGNATTSGCSTIDRCCRARPTVAERLPAINQTNVCRNTVIEATFNQKIDTTSLSDNVHLIGAYPSGTSCSSLGYDMVTYDARPTSRFASIISSVKRLMVKILPILNNNPVFADSYNFCYVRGTVFGYNINETTSKVSFRLAKALEQNITYYVVVKGDPKLGEPGDPKAYYNEKINSFYKVGMRGLVQGGAPSLFGSTTFNNADIWSFTTGIEICKVEKVIINPAFQLFQKPGQVGQTMQAKALSRRNQVIQSIANVYAWDWSWSVDDKDVVTLDPLTGEFSTPTSKNKQDAQTLARAKATITADTVNNPSTQGQSYEGTAQLRVFLCENPWPVYDPSFPPGYVWPWQDSSQGIEFYYCRDKNGVGTADDLPALTETPIVPPGTRKICVFGTEHIGETCLDDNFCGNLPGSCVPEVFKEFFFFRENEPVTPFLEGSVDPLGKAVNLQWDPTLRANKYKVYYGLNYGQYTNVVEVPAGGTKITKKIDNLINGLNYYFAVTALSDKNQESSFSNELRLKPADTTPPAVPSLQPSGGDKKIWSLWDKVPEAKSYVAYLGLTSGNYGLAIPISGNTPTTPNHIFNGLNNDTKYFVTVSSVDQYGNESAKAPEVEKYPNQPYLISLNEGVASLRGKVVVKWSPYFDPVGYKIYYTNSAGVTNDIRVGKNVFSVTTPTLANDTYTFSVKAIIKDNPLEESRASNQRSIIINTTGGGS